MKHKRMGIVAGLLVAVVLAAVAWANTVSEQPYGISTPYWYGHSAGVKGSYYLSFPTLAANDEACGIAATQTLSNKTLSGTTFTGATLESTEDVTAANVITAAECGKTFWLNSATEFLSRLPLMSTVPAGCRFTFIVKAAPSGASYSVATTLENVLIGGINELEVDGSEDGPYGNGADTIFFVNNLAAVGDFVTMISDGTSFYFYGQANKDGGISVVTPE